MAPHPRRIGPDPSYLSFRDTRFGADLPRIRPRLPQFRPHLPQLRRWALRPRPRWSMPGPGSARRKGEPMKPAPWSADNRGMSIDNRGTAIDNGRTPVDNRGMAVDNGRMSRTTDECPWTTDECPSTTDECLRTSPRCRWPHTIVGGRPPLDMGPLHFRDVPRSFCDSPTQKHRLRPVLASRRSPALHLRGI